MSSSRGGYEMDQGYPKGRSVIPPIPEDYREERELEYNRQYGGYSRPEDNPNWPLPDVPLPSAKLVAQPPRVDRGNVPFARPYPGQSNTGQRSIHPQGLPVNPRGTQGLPNTPRQPRQEQSPQFQQQDQREHIQQIRQQNRMQHYGQQKQPSPYNQPTVGRPFLVNMPPRRNQSVDVAVENARSPSMGYPSGYSSTLSPTPSDFPFPDNLISPLPPVFTNPPRNGGARGGVPSSIYSPAGSPMLAPQRPGDTSSRESGSSYASSRVIPSAWAPLRTERIGNDDRYTTDSFRQQGAPLDFNSRDTQYTDYKAPGRMDSNTFENRIGYAVSKDFGAEDFSGPVSPQTEGGYGYFLKPENVPRQVGSELYLMPAMARDSQITVSDIADGSSKPDDRTLVYSPSPTPTNEEFGNVDPIATRLNARGQFSRKAPAGLDLGKVKDAEARGSLTSLPDLIRRATKLAAVLEVGRPGSRLDSRRSIDDFKEYMKENARLRPRRSSFMMLQIAEDEKDGAAGLRSSTASGWPVFGDQGVRGPSASPLPKAKRKICGLPVWAFALLLLLAIIVVAAAVVVPLQLVMLSRNSDKAASNQNTNIANTTIAVECRRTNPCRNGGINVARSDFCGCVCTNGFLGSQCQIEKSANCTTFTPSKELIKSGISNATVGNAVPKFLNLGLAGFDIGLDPSMLLAVFNQQNVTCNSQNALITFLESNGTLSMKLSTPTPSIPADGGLIIDTPAPTIPISETVLEFARVAVLRYAQDLAVQNATTIHNVLETTFKSGRDFGEVNFGGGNIVDLGKREITINGTMVGGINVATPTVTSSTVNALPTALMPTDRP